MTKQAPLVNEIFSNRARNNRSMTINSIFILFHKIFSVNVLFLLVFLVFFLIGVAHIQCDHGFGENEYLCGRSERAYEEFGSFPKSCS